MATLEKRVQVLFDPDRYAQVEAQARAQGMSVGAYIREAVDERVSTEQAATRVSWKELWELADEAPSPDPLGWEQLKADYENEMDPVWRRSHDIFGRPRDDA